MEDAQLKAQENKPEDSKALAEMLNKQKVGHEEQSLWKYMKMRCTDLICIWWKVLVAEIEQIQSRIDDCQKYSERYTSAVKVSLDNFIFLQPRGDV